MHEQIVHGLDVFGEESHCGRPSFGDMQAQAFPGPTDAARSLLIGINRLAKRMFLKASKTP